MEVHEGGGWIFTQVPCEIKTQLIFNVCETLLTFTYFNPNQVFFFFVPNPVHCFTS